MEYHQVPGMIFSFTYLKALKYIALGKKAKTDHPSVNNVPLPGKQTLALFYVFRTKFFLFFFLAQQPPLLSAAALVEGAVLSKENPIIPNEATLRAHLLELQSDCRNAAFRLQFFFKQRDLLLEQIQFVKEQLEAHYGAGT